MKFKDILKLIFFIILIQIIGGTGSIVTVPAIPTWYSGLNKPFFTPPNWLFAPVWTILYITLAVSLYLIWTPKEKINILAQRIFWLQLAANAIWSYLFFGLKSPTLAFLDIIFLLGLTVYLIILNIKISKLASYILIPYLLWLSFATLLNLAIITLN